MSLGLNSGTGTNDGIYRVKFTDGMEICFITSGGEVSGLTHGDRKFNLVGKGIFFFIKHIFGLQGRTSSCSWFLIPTRRDFFP